MIDTLARAHPKLSLMGTLFVFLSLLVTYTSLNALIFILDVIYAVLLYYIKNFKNIKAVFHCAGLLQIICFLQLDFEMSL